jgi:hypothetical protein
MFQHIATFLTVWTLIRFALDELGTRSTTIYEQLINYFLALSFFTKFARPSRDTLMSHEWTVLTKSSVLRIATHAGKLCTTTRQGISLP